MADKDGSKIGKLRGKRIEVCFAHCFLIIKVLLGMNPPVQLSNLSLLCYALACVDCQHSSGHRNNRTKQLNLKQISVLHLISHRLTVV